MVCIPHLSTLCLPLIVIRSPTSLDLCRLIVAEMFDGKYVAVAMSICSQMNWACNFIIGLVFPYMNKYLGAYSFGPFATVLAITFVFALTVLPETQGTTPDELIQEMTRRNSRSMVYEVNEEDAGAIDLEWRKAMEQLMKEEQAQMQQGTFGKYRLALRRLV